AIFFAVVPTLQSSLENQRLRELQRVAPAFTPLIQGAINKEIKAPSVNKLVRSLADSSDAEVTLFDIQRQRGARPQPYPISNSLEEKNYDASPGLASLAYTTGRVQSRVLAVNGDRTAQVAVPVPKRHPNKIA